MSIVPHHDRQSKDFLGVPYFPTYKKGWGVWIANVTGKICNHLEDSETYPKWDIFCSYVGLAYVNYAYIAMKVSTWEFIWDWYFACIRQSSQGLLLMLRYHPQVGIGKAAAARSRFSSVRWQLQLLLEILWRLSSSLNGVCVIAFCIFS